MYIEPVEISDDFRFPSKEIVWSEKDLLKWVFSLRQNAFFCLKNNEIISEIKLDEVNTVKAMNSALLFVYKRSGRFPMVRLAKAMGKACKAYGVEDFQAFLALNDETPTPWV